MCFLKSVFQNFRSSVSVDESRGVFRILSNIFEGVFWLKLLTDIDL